MTTMEITGMTSANSPVSIGKCHNFPAVYRCHLAIIRDEDGGFSVVVLNLPGTGSCGATEEDAMSNVREAVSGVIESYREDGMEVPWESMEAYEGRIPDGAKLKWILVHA